MGVWIPGYYDGKDYIKGHIAEGTISQVVDEIQRTGKLPRPKPAAEKAGASAPVAGKAVDFKIEVPLTGEKIGEVKVEGQDKPSLEKRVDSLAETLEKLTKLVERL